MKILVTGFTPFGGETINPSWEAVRALDDSIAGADIIKCEIPTEFEASIDALQSCNRRTSAECHPLCRTVRRQSIHSDRTRRHQSAGRPHPPITQASSHTTSRLLTARRRLFSTIPTRQITDRLRAAGIPARSPTPPGLMYATTCSMLRYMKARRQKKKTLHAAVLSMFPICPIRLLPPFPMLPV